MMEFAPFGKSILRLFRAFRKRLVFLYLYSLDYFANSRDIKYEVSELSEWLNMHPESLREWLYEMPVQYHYESFRIPKRNGRGYRCIDAPNPALKKLQRDVYHKLLKSLRPHNSAIGYSPKKSIVDNAIPHVGQKVVVNIDLKNFFRSIKSRRVLRYWRLLGWSFEASTILTNICCYNDCLPQGAPTSPALSNLCNQLLDSRLSGLVEKWNGQYTRYSDDLTFSFSDPYSSKRGILKQINSILESEGYQIQIKKKIRVQRAHQRQTTTGLVVNEKVSLPRPLRKRIRAMQHHRLKGTLSKKDSFKLAGYEGLLAMVEKVNVNMSLKKRNNLARIEPRLSNVSKILFLGASPVDTARLRLGKEVHEIDESLRRSNCRDKFKLFQKHAVRIVDIRRALLDDSPQIVHFSGHGSGVEGLIVEDEKGFSCLLSTEALESLFELCREHVRCVILNACYSEEQAEAISKHIHYVVGMNQAIGDQAAIVFSTGFYDALGAGKSLDVSYKFGCQAIQSLGIPEHLTPVLKIRACA